MVTVTTAAVLISFALHMDKVLYPDNTALRVYCVITVIGEPVSDRANIQCFLGYVIGFLLCIVGLTLMNTGQPALLYLVPCTLGPLLVTALVRGDFLVIWRGKKHVENSITLVSSSQCRVIGSYCFSRRSQVVKRANYTIMNVMKMLNNLVYFLLKTL